MSDRPPDRAVVFVDGNNWYHSLKPIAAGRVELMRVAQKLCGPRDLRELRFYIGRVPNSGNKTLYDDQRRYLAWLQGLDRRVSIFFGRLEPRRRHNDVAEELLAYLAKLKTELKIELPRQVYWDLHDIGHRNRMTETWVEKAVDVMLAVDIVVMAERNEYDVAYVLSADGDYTHAVKFVRDQGKRVYAASPGPAAQLAASVNAFIRIDAEWLEGCYAD